jgi:hypothetical protein
VDTSRRVAKGEGKRGIEGICEVPRRDSRAPWTPPSTQTEALAATSPNFRAKSSYRAYVQTCRIFSPTALFPTPSPPSSLAGRVEDSKCLGVPVRDKGGRGGGRGGGREEGRGMGRPGTNVCSLVSDDHGRGKERDLFGGGRGGGGEKL